MLLEPDCGRVLESFDKAARGSQGCGYQGRHPRQEAKGVQDARQAREADAGGVRVRLGAGAVPEKQDGDRILGDREDVRLGSRLTQRAGRGDGDVVPGTCLQLPRGMCDILPGFPDDFDAASNN